MAANKKGEPRGGRNHRRGKGQSGPQDGVSRGSPSGSSSRGGSSAGRSPWKAHGGAQSRPRAGGSLGPPAFPLALRVEGPRAPATPAPTRASGLSRVHKVTPSSRPHNRSSHEPRPSGSDPGAVNMPVAAPAPSSSPAGPARRPNPTAAAGQGLQPDLQGASARWQEFAKSNGANTRPAATLQASVTASIQQQALHATNLAKASRGLDFKQKWRQWSSVSIRIDSLPHDTTIGDLVNYFQGHGDLVHARLEDRAGSAIIRFSPVPAESFWQNGTAAFKKADRWFTVIPVLLSPPTTTSPARKGIQLPEQMTLSAQDLAIGFPSAANTVEMMGVISVPGLDPVRLVLDLKFRNLQVFFVGSSPTSFNAQVPELTPEHKIQTPFGNIEKIVRVETDEKRWSLLLFLGSPPTIYRQRNPTKHDAPKADQRLWTANDLWQRTVGVDVDRRAIKLQKTSLRRPKEYVDVGKWTTFELTFTAEENTAWHTFSAALQDFNVKTSTTTGSELMIRPGSKSCFWDMIGDERFADGPTLQSSFLHNLDAAHLPFDVRYQLEAAISQGVFSEQSITREFLAKLEDLNDKRGKRLNKAKNFLEYVTDTGKRVFDPMSIFEDNAARKYYPPLVIPSHCVWVRKVIVTPSTIYLSSPTLETANRVLRQYSDRADRFLRVQFTDEKAEGPIRSRAASWSMDPILDRVYHTLKEGLWVGGRHFEFLAFGNSQIREHGAYFFSPDFDSCDDIRKWMGDFSHIKVVAKYASRLGQCFSTTRTPAVMGLGLSVRKIDDIEAGGWCFSDGVGMISSELASEVAARLKYFAGRHHPSAYQIRLGGSKGIVVTWPEARFNEVCIRPSQTKFEAMSKKLEIIRPSRFSIATLNRQTITILGCLGVPNEAFVNLAQAQIREYERAMTNPEAALELLTRSVDENGTTTTLAQMIQDGFMATKEPFFLGVLELWRVWCMKLLREKARVVVEKGAFLFGCVDETKTLRGHTKSTEGQPGKDISKLPQIFLQVPKAGEPETYVVITGVCVVGRNPSLHPGDLRVVEAVDVAQLRHLRDVVVFPATGDQDVPSMCSGGDLDGDDYFVLWDPDLIPTEWNHPPMVHAGAKPNTKPHGVPVTMDDVKSFFVQYIKNDSLGRIAHAHLAWADLAEEGPKDLRCLQLAQLHSNAVDYVKSGIRAEMPQDLNPKSWPHFMEKGNKTHLSRKALGYLYNLVQNKLVDFKPKLGDQFDKRILRRYKIPKDMLKQIRDIKGQYDLAVRRIMNQRMIRTEFEVWSTFVMSKPRVGSDYKMREDMGEVVQGLKDQFVEVCVEAAGAPDRNSDEYYQLVAATYLITWEEVMMSKQTQNDGEGLERDADDTPMISFPWLFATELGKIASESTEENQELAKLPRVPIPDGPEDESEPVTRDQAGVTAETPQHDEGESSLRAHGEEEYATDLGSAKDLVQAGDGLEKAHEVGDDRVAAATRTDHRESRGGSLEDADIVQGMEQYSSDEDLITFQ